MGVGELPDYGGDDGDQLSQELKENQVWVLPSWFDIEETLRDIIKTGSTQSTPSLSLLSQTLFPSRM